MFIDNDASDSPANTRWRKWEKRLLILITVVSVSNIVLNALDLSARVSAQHKLAGLSPTFWTSTSLADLSDGQLKSFRSNLPLLSIGAVLFVLAKQWWQRHGDVKGDRAQLQFYVASGLAICFYLHGPGLVFLLLWASLNYYLSTFTRGMKYFSLTVWVMNLTFLVLTEFYNGYRFRWIGLPGLDGFHPEMPWFRCSNLCFLKLISYLMDAHWQSLKIPTTPKEKHLLRCPDCTETLNCIKFRQETHVDDYSFLAFMAYFLYFPLYLAGPILSYNAWRSQVTKPQETFDWGKKVKYGARLLAAVVLLELSIHYLYFPTIANNPRNRHIWEAFSAYELAIASYLVLKWIWLKFLVIWRFFRLWAICDGFDSPENMGRCMSNNYCFEGFWRMWHRAFNQWLIRYLFVPLGGSKYKVYNIWVVFGFVAIWHDLRLHLLVWGWGMCLFIVPEVLAKAFISQKRFTEFRKSWVYNWLCAVSGGLYIIIMMIANLIGFSFGLPGLYSIWDEILNGEGVKLLLQTWLLGTFVTLLMFAIRREEGEARTKY